MWSREWRCSWSSADKRCSNYIWVIDNFIVYWGAAYIRGFTVAPIVASLGLRLVILLHPSAWYSGCLFWAFLHQSHILWCVFDQYPMLVESFSICKRDPMWSVGNIKLCLIFEFCSPSLHSYTYRERNAYLLCFWRDQLETFCVSYKLILFLRRCNFLSMS